MSSPPPQRRPTAPIPTLASRAASALRASSTLQSTPERLPGSSNILSTTAPTSTVKPSLGNLTGRSFSGGGLPSGGINSSGLPSRPAKTIAAPALKAAQRTTKTSQKLVVLPSEVQTAPLPLELQSRAVSDDDSTMGPPTVRFPPKHHEHRSEGERMTKAERQRAGYRRLAAYCIAEGFRMKLLLAYLKREHGVAPRVFDEAIYALYHLPLLPGYGPNVNIRSSAAPRSPEGGSILSQLSDVEDLGYDGTYFATPSSPEQYSLLDGYISGSPPVPRTQRGRPATADAGATDTAVEFETDVEPTSSSPSTSPVAPFTPIASNAPPPQPTRKPTSRSTRSQKAREEDRIAEIIVFDYGVVVFFGFEEGQERDVLEDFERALISVRPRAESNWEIEHCHYVYDPSVASPRIYNDFFTFKSHSHLLKLSLSHAIGQSVLLGHYETTTQAVLSSGQTMSIPKQLATTGELKLGRSDALRLTGRLFKLRRDVNLVSNVLDIPELFWSEASLKDLYQACREYFEIDSRVEVLNQKLGVTSELLDIIHDHLNNGAMIRITWIIIWLIVAACLVELGEVIARLAVYDKSSTPKPKTLPLDAIRIVEQIMSS